MAEVYHILPEVTTGKMRTPSKSQQFPAKFCAPIHRKYTIYGHPWVSQPVKEPQLSESESWGSLTGWRGAPQGAPRCFAEIRFLCRAGPMCPAAGYAFFGGARGPRPTGRYVEPRVGDGVPDVPSARRCRAGNGFQRRFAPRSKCPWGTPRNDRGGVYRHAATIRQDGVSFLTVPGETPASGRAAPPAPRRSAPAGRPGRR